MTDSNADTQPPTLLKVGSSPSTIDVSSSGVNVTITLQVSDNLAGVDLSSFGGPLFALMPPATGSNAVILVFNNDFQLVAGTANNGTWQAVRTIPRYSAAGAWQIQYVNLFDAIGNSIFLDTTQLQRPA